MRGLPGVIRYMHHTDKQANKELNKQSHEHTKKQRNRLASKPADENKARKDRGGPARERRYSVGGTMKFECAQNIVEAVGSDVGGQKIQQRVPLKKHVALFRMHAWPACDGMNCTDTKLNRFGIRN